MGENNNKIDDSLNTKDDIHSQNERKTGWFFFLLTKIEVKNKKISIEMQPDKNHQRPHIHVNYHNASYAIDNGDCLAGNLETKYEKIVRSWINSHSSDLLQLWNDMKSAKSYQDCVELINSRWEYDGIYFNGNQPSRNTEIDGVRVWYSKNIPNPNIVNGNKVYEFKGDVCVLFPKDYQGKIQIISVDGECQKKILNNN